jgi:hypothetical protein
MNPINLFGLTMKSGVSNKDYIDSKFITLAKEMQTKIEKAGDKMTGNLDMNSNRLTNVGNAIDKQDCVTKNQLELTTDSIKRSVQLKLNTDGDSMSGKLDMMDHRISNVKFPLDSSDAANKLYVQNYTEFEEMDVEKLCKIGGIISLLASKQAINTNNLNTCLAYTISLYNKYKSFSEAYVNNDVSKSVIFVNLKVNVIKIILGLSKDLIKELNEELNKENLFSLPERGIRKRYRRFINKAVEEADPQGINSELQLLLHKNIFLIDIGFIYLIDTLMHKILLT